ncbi:hypothetical protein AAEO56_06120 [Flavobacterium sp. DGU11]|uniref:Uncharacterized protein n=1 Tax=Flavobacterium arundinis TaxID=3139143 RepID=A0ABU9HWD3_9FLAO
MTVIIVAQKYQPFSPFDWKDEVIIKDKPIGNNVLEMKSSSK